jgi:hypothetical protein
MAATLASFASILKEFYLGPIQDQLNNETLVCDMFEKASVDWNGRQVIIPVHIARNANVAFVAEGGALPGPLVNVVGMPGVANASSQGYTNLTATAEFLYGRFQVTGPAMASAGKGGANSFVGWVDGEMNRLVTDIKNQCNRSATSGGTCVGFVTMATPIIVGAPVDVLFDGDNVKLTALIAAEVAGQGPDLVDLIRLDTYATVGGGGATVTLAAGATPGTVNIAAGVANLNFAADAATPAGAIPVAMIATANATAAVVGGVANLTNYTNEPVGIYGNLGLPGTGVLGAELDWFGVDRTTLTGTANALGCSDGAAVPTSNLLSTVLVATPPVRVAITLPQLQTVFDRVDLASDELPDVLLCNPLQRTRIAAMLQANLTFNTGLGSAPNKVGDGGYTGFAFAGVPIKTSRHVDNGQILALHTKHWKMLELEAGKFADEDGDVLSRVGIADAYEGFYKWYYNVICVRPNSNGAITGLTL